MNQAQKIKTYDLEERTFQFAYDIRMVTKTLSKAEQYSNDVQQLIRSSGSVGANYIEANESLSKKDFYMRIRICRKEAKESAYWIKLLTSISQDDKKYTTLYDEALQLTRIFGSILSNAKT